MKTRNRLISGAYAQLYLSDPETFKWAGMAGYASRKVGEGMRDASALGAVSAVDGDEMGQALEEGNKAIFDDMYWQHLAFQNGGLEELEKAAAAGQVTPEQLESWRQLKAADEKRDVDPEAAEAEVWAANKALLFHEQDAVLQDGVYDHHRQLFQDVSSAWAVDLVGFDSPIPGDESDFEDDVEGGDIGNLDDRWRWIDEKMLPAWQDRDANHRAETVADMEQMVDRAHAGTRDEAHEGGTDGGPGFWSPFSHFAE
jgi:hypothetical protein